MKGDLFRPDDIHAVADPRDLAFGHIGRGEVFPNLGPGLKVQCFLGMLTGHAHHAEGRTVRRLAFGTEHQAISDGFDFGHGSYNGEDAGSFIGLRKWASGRV